MHNHAFLMELILIIRKLLTRITVGWKCGNAGVSRIWNGWIQRNWKRQNWAGLNIIGMVKSHRTINGKTSVDVRYYISSLEMNAKLFGSAVRQHWGIENSFHWVLDIVFREDECRIRKGNAAENIGILRHMALNLLKKDKGTKAGIAAKRKKAG